MILLLLLLLLLLGFHVNLTCEFGNLIFRVFDLRYLFPQILCCRGEEEDNGEELGKPSGYRLC